MPTAFEEITLGYKIASLMLEIGRSVGNQAKSWKDKSSHRFLSSMTTLEITDDTGIDQVAHYVQDRTVKIARDGARMPPFTSPSAARPCAASYAPPNCRLRRNGGRESTALAAHLAPLRHDGPHRCQPS